MKERYNKINFDLKEMFHVYLHHPFTMLVAGPTGSGKTRWVEKLIKEREKMIFPIIKNIKYFYGEYQDWFSQTTDVSFIHDLEVSEIATLDSSEPNLIIIDDLMDTAANSDAVSNLFTRGSHHNNISVILIVQNFFTRGKVMRNLSLNSHYIVLFKNSRDKMMIMNIARQMYPSNVKRFLTISNDATEKPFSYLFIDLKPDTPENLRLLTNVLGEEKFITVYKII